MNFQPIKNREIMRHLIIILLSLTLSSCHSEKILFEGKFVKGTVISKAHGVTLGIIEMTKLNETYPSFIALYEESEAPDLEKSNKYYFQVSEFKGTPLAKNFRKQLPKGEEAYNARFNPITCIDTHSFYGHDHDSQKHILTHLSLLTVPSNEDGYFTFEARDENDDHVAVFRGKKDINARREVLSGTQFYIEVDEGTDLITKIDTCHYHANEPVVCRSQL